MDPVTLYERAASGAATMVGKVRPEQLGGSTPCSEWDVTALLNHMVAGTGYLFSALGLEPAPGGTDEDSYRDAVARCVEMLRRAGAVDGRCMSPVGFEWSVGEAVAGTTMDQLVHTWDLAVAIGGSRRLDPELAEACVAMFVPQMPEIGRGRRDCRTRGTRAGRCPRPGSPSRCDGPASVSDGVTIDDAVRALGHPGRRAMLHLVRDGEHTASELAAVAGLSPSAASPHLKLLRECGLIRVRVDAKRRHYRLDIERLVQVRAALDEMWGDRLDTLKVVAETNPGVRQQGRSA